MARIDDAVPHLFNDNDNRFCYLIQENVLDSDEFIAGGRLSIITAAKSYPASWNTIPKPSLFSIQKST